MTPTSENDFNFESSFHSRISPSQDPIALKCQRYPSGQNMHAKPYRMQKGQSSEDILGQ